MKVSGFMMNLSFSIHTPNNLSIIMVMQGIVVWQMTLGKLL